MSLLLSHIQGYHYHLPKFRIYVLVHCIGVSLSLIPLLSVDSNPLNYVLNPSGHPCPGTPRLNSLLHVVPSSFLNLEYLHRRVIFLHTNPE